MTLADLLPSVRSADTRWRILALHLAPGIPLTLFAGACAPLLLALHLPVVWGLLVGVLVVQVPLLETLRHVVGPASTPSPARHPRLVAVVAALAAASLPGLVVWAEPVLRESVFAWVPSWWSPAPTGDGPLTWGITIALWLAAAVLAGPICEERYFRGVLLGRVPGGAWGSAAAGAALFAGYHLWEPWAVLTVLAFAFPLCLARTRFGLGIVGCSVVHCGVNAAMLAVLVSGLVSR